MSNATAKITMEDRESLSVGIANGDIKHAPLIADVTNRWSMEAQEEYGTDDVLMVNGQPLRALVGAAAVRSAYFKKFGEEPHGIQFAGMPPITRRLEVQEFVYRLLDGTVVRETDLDNPRVWNVERVSNYLEAWRPEVEQPRHVFPHHRAELLAHVKEGLPIVGTPNRTINVPWGGLSYPGIDDFTMLVTEVEGKEYGVDYPVSRFVIIAKKQYQEAVDEFYDLVMEEVRSSTVYQGRALIWDKGTIRPFDVMSAVDATQVIHTREREFELEHEVWAPLCNIQQCRSIDPRMFNKKVVLSGEAGTGKTITAVQTGQKAIQHGVTVVFMTPGSAQDFEEAKKFGATVTPAMICVEDLESYMPDMEGLTTQQQHEARSKLLDQIDGGDTKGKEVMWILTTNFPEMWISAMARPGRTDSFFEFEPLDREGFERLLRMKLGASLSDDIDFDAVWEMISDMSSSFLAGLVDKARSYLLGHPEGYKLTNEDFAAAVRSLSRQWGWYKSLVSSERAARAETVTEFYDRVVRPVVKDELASVGIK